MRRVSRACVGNAVVTSSARASMASAGGVSLLSEMRRVASTATASLPSSAALSGRARRDSAHESKWLRVDAAAHRAMLIVGRFLTGRRARQRTACFGTKGLALLNNANIASTDRPACLIASAAYCRVSYSTGLASIASARRADAGCNQLQPSLRVVRCCARNGL